MDTASGRPRDWNATKVVSDVLGGVDVLIYQGLWASMERYITTCVPSSWFVSLFRAETSRATGSVESLTRIWLGRPSPQGNRIGCHIKAAEGNRG